MKLRTSFFNFRVMLKNITRFAPLWVLYAVGEVLGLCRWIWKMMQPGSLMT